MRILMIAAFAASFPLTGSLPALAQTGTMNGVQHGTGAAKARCSPGDPNVMVNRKTKTYTMDTSAKSAKAVKKDTAMSGMQDTGTNVDKTGMVSMCKSEADSMGAKMTGKMSKTGMSGM